MRRMDELHLAHPFHGSRQVARHLRREGVVAGRHRVRRLMGHGGDLPEAAHQRGQPGAPRVSVPAARSGDRASGPGVVRGHHLHPCFARVLLPGRRDGLGQPPRPVVAAVEHHGQRVLRRRARRRAALRHPGDLQHRPGGAPTARSRTFTSTAFTERVRACGALCSMDGRGRYLDNIFIERLWRSLKYEAVYLHELADARDVERVVGSWFRFYGESRPHSSLGGRNPRRGLPGRPGGGRVSRPRTMGAGNATALAASSRCAAPPLRSGPSGDPASAAANGLATTGRVLPVVTDRLSRTTGADASTMPLTSSASVGRFRASRAQHQSEYTLTPPSDCPTNQDHLSRLASAVRSRVVRRVKGLSPARRPSG